jgi:predicted nucleic acid-binding Zn ribbon protein
MAKSKKQKKPTRPSTGQIVMLIFSIIIVLSVVLSLFKI